MALKIIIERKNGLISGVFVNKKGAEVLIFDRDYECADPDEIMTEKEVRDFVQDYSFFPANKEVWGIAEFELPEEIFARKG